MAAAAAPMVNCRRVICMLSPVGEWMASSAALSRRPGSIEADVQFLDQRMPAGDLLLYEPAELLRRGCEWLHAKVGKSLGNLRAGDHFANVGTQLGCMGPCARRCYQVTSRRRSARNEVLGVYGND